MFKKKIRTLFEKLESIIINLLKSCKNRNHLTQLHSLTIKTGLAQRTFFAAKLIDLYCKFTSLNKAHKLFDEIPRKNVNIWNSILNCYCRAKRCKDTIFIFSRLLSYEKPNSFSVSIALKACSWLKALDVGKVMHGFVKKSDQIGSNLFVGSGLVELYSKCGKMCDALSVFEEYSEPDIVLWTTMVTGYEQNGEPEKALEFFARMVIENGVVPDSITLVSVVSACSQLLNLQAGKSVHGYLIRLDSDSSLPLLNALLNLYGRTGSVSAAAKLFSKMEEKDVISWGAIITCFAHNGAHNEAIDLFNELVINGIDPNEVSIISALQACEASCNIQEGKKIHEVVLRKHLESHILVSTALIDMYMNCSSPDEAFKIFNRMASKDAICWSSLLCGCVRNRLGYKSMEVFRDMLASDILPDTMVMVNVLTACSELGILQQTCCIHGFLIKYGFYYDSFIAASLIESYAKCGSVNGAIMVFKGAEDRDVVIWSSMIAAYGLHGHGHNSIDVFNNMIRYSDVKPNDVTFLSVLSSCSHAGLVREGMEIFNMMLNDYQLTPGSKHFSIVVDMLGRSGELEHAMDFVNQMPGPVGPHVWGALLGACQVHNNTKMGEAVAKKLIQLDPSNSGYYVMLSNIYAGDGKWDDAAEFRTLVKEKHVKKLSGYSQSIPS